MPIKVEAIKFSIMSPKMIRKLGTVEVSRPELYDKDGYPIEGGIMDPRLGVIDPGMRCRVCGGGVGTCLGHFGYLEIARPVFHVRYIKTVYDVLRSTCHKCARPLANSDELKRMRNPLLVIPLLKRKKCPHCSEKQRIIKLAKPHSFTIDNDNLNALHVREWFEKITDEDAKAIGIRGGRPEWLIITLMPIPPTTVRPSITLETGERSEDDLTHKLVDIVRINQRLKDDITVGAPEFIIEDHWELLQYHVSTFFDNELAGIPPARHRSGRALRTLTQRLKGKEGRFRNNLSGKRVNFSSRTVISPDPNLSIDEVGVPETIAKELTVPARVNKMNLEEMKALVKKGPKSLEGANYILRPDERRKKITEENKDELAEEVIEGYVVERHLKDGDVVIFNRQPSLHRMSIMCHKVRLMPYRTFRFNPCVCRPYNADFDGDEMNLHVPQTEEAQTEAEMLMLVQKHIRSPRFGGPIIGGHNDHVSGIYLLTKDPKIPREKANHLLAAVAMDTFVDGDVSGRELFSMILPKDLNIKFKSNNPFGATKDMEVLIQKGKLVRGVIDAKAIGSEKGILLDRIEKLYGSEVAKTFLDRVSKLAIEYLAMRGFTIGLDDQDLTDEAKKKIKKVVEDAQHEASKLIENFKKNDLEQLPGQTLKESLETHILKALSHALEKCGEVVASDLKDNDLITMAMSGARGNIINMTQLVGCIGQQTLQGERINRGYHGRTLPHFKAGDLTPKTHGFIGTAFKSGLDPFEFFFNAMNGRENLMDKSLLTRHSGYMERRLVNALQDLKVENDGTVRGDRNMIIQFLPAEDGVDPAKSDWGKVDVKAIVESVVGAE